MNILNCFIKNSFNNYFMRLKLFNTSPKKLLINIEQLFIYNKIHKLNN